MTVKDPENTAPANSQSIKRLRGRSISRDLTVSLTLTVTVVSVVTISLIYFSVSHRVIAQINEKADEYANSLATVLDMPLWNIDEQSISSTGKAFASNEIVESIRITDNTGKIYFTMEKKSNSPLVRRTRDILHQGQLVGHLEIALTSKYIMESNRQLLWAALVTICVTILALALMTVFLLRIFLNKPLQRLGKIVKYYAEGRYDATEQQMPYFEFKTMVEVLSEMGGKITWQMRELRDAEKKYRG